VVLSNPGFRTLNNFPAFREKFRQACPRPKEFKNVGFEGHQIISLPKAPTYLWSAVFVSAKWTDSNL
jgi:hypothetical protein